MVEYIEREAAIRKALDACIKVVGHGISQVAAVDIVEAMETIPTADVVEVRRGEWVFHECVSSYEGAISGFSCSECSIFVTEETFDAEDFNTNFCGNCGAKMDGKGEGDG